MSGAWASRPRFDCVPDALHAGDTLTITTLDRLGRSTQHMLELAELLRGRGAGLRVLNLGGGEVDTSISVGSMLFTIMAALGQVELEIKREWVLSSISKRRAAMKELGRRWQSISDSQVRSALLLVEAGGGPVTQVARDLSVSRAAFCRRVRAMTPPPPCRVVSGWRLELQIP